MRRALIFLLMTLLLSSSSYANAEGERSVSMTESGITVYMDNERMFFNELPLIEHGTTLVQFRPVFEKLGLRIDWDSEMGTVTGTKGNFKLILQINNPNAIINGVVVALTAAPRLVNGYTFVPLRFVGEASGSKVSWNENSRSIAISSTILSRIQDVVYADDDNVRYEGQKKGTKREGNGKLFYQGKLFYEGSFQEDMLSGKGKLYDPVEEKMYEGQFKENKMNGQVSLYSTTSGKKVFEGIWENGEKNGYGILYSNAGTVWYDGKFKDNLFNGEGKLYDSISGKLFYQGEFQEGLMKGKGKLFDSRGFLRYEGEFQDDLKQGIGKSYSIKGMINYEGSYKNGVRDGIGTMFFPDGGTYFGGFKDGTFEGHGKYTSTYYSFEGDFKGGYELSNRTIQSYEPLEQSTLITDYTEGYTYQRSSPNTPLLRKLAYGSRPRSSFYVGYLPYGGNNQSPPLELISIQFLSKSDYEKNPSAYTWLAERNDKVYAYALKPNPYANEGASKWLYDEFNEALLEAEKVIKTFKLMDIKEI